MKRLFVMPALVAAGLAVFATQANANALRGPITGINPALMPPMTDLNPDAFALTVVSTDPFTNSDSFHKTEVGPYTNGFGSTLVSVFQQGRYSDGGGSDIGWATSSDSGKTWKHGSFTGITKIENPSNPYDRASDPSVAYDAKKGVRIASILPLNVDHRLDAGHHDVDRRLDLDEAGAQCEEWRGCHHDAVHRMRQLGVEPAQGQLLYPIVRPDECEPTGNGDHQ